VLTVVGDRRESAALQYGIAMIFAILGSSWSSNRYCEPKLGDPLSIFVAWTLVDNIETVFALQHRLSGSEQTASVANLSPTPTPMRARIAIACVDVAGRDSIMTSPSSREAHA
jgi:hypothetical protein